MDNPLEFTPANVMKLHAKLEKLKKTYVAQVQTSTDYRILLQVHVDFYEKIFNICKEIWKNICFIYVAKYIMCVSMKHLVR